MENQNKDEYGQTDPDFIDQNTLVDGQSIQNEDFFKKKADTELNTEFGETDPDIIEQNTPIDNDNYARDEDPYQHQEEFIEDFKNPENDVQNNSSESDDTANQNENIKKEDEAYNQGKQKR